MNPSRVHGVLMAAAILMIQTGGAHAEPPTANAAVITARAHQKCRLDTQAQPSGVATNLGSLSGAGLSLAELGHPGVAASRPAAVRFAFSGFCNAPHRLVLESERNGLWLNAGAIAFPDLSDSVPYRVAARWAGAGVTLDADARSRRRSDAILRSAAPGGGAIEILFTITPNASGLGDGVPLAAGRYADVLRISLEPGE